MSSNGYSPTDPRIRTTSQIQPAQQPQPQVQTPEGIEKQGNNLMIPMEQVQKAAEMYAKFKPMLGWILPRVGFKMPKELDEFLSGIASGQPVTEEKVTQQMQELDIEPRVGEPVMTFKLAADAWLMHNEGASLREIAKQFTDNGNPVSYQTVARWYNDYDDYVKRREESKALTVFGAFKKIGKWSLIIGLGTLWIVVIQHLHFF